MSTLSSLALTLVLVASRERPPSLPESQAARALVDEAMSFQRPRSPLPEASRPASPEPTGPILEPSETAAINRSGAFLTARFEAPVRATAEVLFDPARPGFQLRDLASDLQAEIVLEGGLATAAQVGRGHLVYPHALGAATLISRVTGDGSEDFLLFSRRPAQEQVAWTIRLGPAVRGLRMIGSVLELLDAGGTPRLRMSAPYLVDARGRLRDVEIRLEGCRADRDPRAPWGREVTQPGSRSCRLVLDFSGAAAAYPMLLDPAWTTTLGLSLPRRFATASPLAGGRALIAGGVRPNNTLAADAELFDPATLTFALTGKLFRPRAYHSATVLASGKVLVAGGTAALPLASSEKYDVATGLWTDTATALVGARAQHVSVLLKSGKVLVAGGYADANGATPLDTAELYDPVVDGWAATGRMLTARMQAAAAPLPSGKALVAGGKVPGAVSGSAELFDEVAGQFTATAAIPGERYYHSMLALKSGPILVAGGFGKDPGSNDRYLASTHLYQESTGAWTAGGPLSEARSNLALAQLVPSGHALAAGGVNLTGERQVVDEFDPAGPSWSVRPALNTARSSPAFATLSGGGVLVVSNTDGELYGLSPVGAACTTGADCARGFCADGVCCDGACAGQCEACNAQGKCTARIGAPAGTRAACSSDGSACGGACNGADRTACSFPAGTVTCGAPTCATGVERPAPTCNGLGNCAMAQPRSCGAFGCGTTSCRTSCLSGTDCAAGNRCSGGSCVPTLTKGASCAAAEECASHFCSGGACCDTACLDACGSCNQAGKEGTCSPRTGSCGAFLCDGTSLACPAGCSGDSACASPNRCVGGTCRIPQEGPDAGSASDAAAASPMDSGTAATDAGSSSPPDGSSTTGCGCQGTGEPSGALPLLALALWVATRRGRLAPASR